MPLVASVWISDATKSYDREYSYLIPEEYYGSVKPGMKVIVPFGRKDTAREGIIGSIQYSDEPVDAAAAINAPKIKTISKVLFNDPFLTEKMLDLVFWMKHRYVCTFYDAARCILPTSSSMREKRLKAACLAVHAHEAVVLINSGALDRIQHIRALEMLLESEFIPLQDFEKHAGISRSVLNTLKKRGLIDFVDQEVIRNPFEGIGCEKNEPYTPTDNQYAAIQSVKAKMDAGVFDEFVLHGITGSGKTEVYLHAIKHALDMGKSAIMLVPEISLTPQTVERIRGRFGDTVAVIHSRLSPGERYDQWRMVYSGAKKVVIGARSAVFAPLEDLGLIILDEEHDAAYKSEIPPKYHAAEVARERCRRNNAVLILGSATPSVETYYNASVGSKTVIRLSERPGPARLPSVDLVDMREELSRGNRSIFSSKLFNEISANLKTGEQTILLMNRRGYSSFVLCRNCGFVARCPDCNVTLTCHASPKSANKLVCHYCGFTSAIPSGCPSCGSVSIKQFGAGTQRIEQEVMNKFPGASVIRMDTDTTACKNAHNTILRRFRDENINILVGTQMVAKGHDFPNVTLVGVLAADSMLNIPDFRASERTFQLLTQVAGRAGRGTIPGRVVIQAYNVEDYSINTACRQDYELFFNQEIEVRKKLDYPPFTNIAEITVSSADDSRAGKYASAIKQKIIGKSDSCDQGCDIMGPGRCPISRLNGKFRWRIIIKCPDMEKLIHMMTIVTGYVSGTAARSDIAVSVDINPYDML